MPQRAYEEPVMKGIYRKRNAAVADFRAQMPKIADALKAEMKQDVARGPLRAGNIAYVSSVDLRTKDADLLNMFVGCTSSIGWLKRRLKRLVAKDLGLPKRKLTIEFDSSSYRSDSLKICLVYRP